MAIGEVQEVKTRDGRKQQAKWQASLAFHEAQVKRLKELLSKKPGAVSTRRASATTRKWLEGMTVPQLHAQASLVGIEGAEGYDDLDDLIFEVLVRMGLEDAADRPTKEGG